MTTKPWWDTVDALAARVVGPLVARHPELVAAMDEWAVDDDMWVVRTALLHQLIYKEATDAERLFDYCSRQAGHTDFFMRKAIGWALREYAKTDPAAVRAFVHAHAAAVRAVRARGAEEPLKQSSRGVGQVLCRPSRRSGVSAGMRASPASGQRSRRRTPAGPGSTVRATSPAADSSASRSESTESLTPSIARDSSRKPGRARAQAAEHEPRPALAEHAEGPGERDVAAAQHRRGGRVRRGVTNRTLGHASMLARSESLVFPKQPSASGRLAISRR